MRGRWHVYWLVPAAIAAVLVLSLDSRGTAAGGPGGGVILAQADAGAGDGGAAAGEGGAEGGEGAAAGEGAGGEGAKVTETATNLMEDIKDLYLDLKKGGKTMVFLLFLSVMGLAFILERTVRLRKSAIAPSGLAAAAANLWNQGRIDELDALCRKRPSTLSRIIRFVTQHSANPVADVSAGAGDIASRELRVQLQRGYPLAVVATLSPLLGLLGTVIGMIEAFEKVTIAGSMGDATYLSGSISKALITTAAGLVIAIPALGFYHFFRSRTTTYGILLEEQASSFINECMLKKGR